METVQIIYAAVGITIGVLLVAVLLRRRRGPGLPRLITQKPRNIMRSARVRNDFDLDEDDESRLTIVGLNHQETRHLKHLIDDADVYIVAAFLARHAARCVELDTYMEELKKQYLELLDILPQAASESDKRRAARRIKYPPTSYWMTFANIHKEDLIYFFEVGERHDRAIPPGLIDKFGGEDFIANLTRYAEYVKSGAVTLYLGRNDSDFDWLDGLSRTGAVTRSNAIPQEQRLAALGLRTLQRRARAVGITLTNASRSELAQALSQRPDTEAWMQQEFNLNGFFHLPALNVDIRQIEREWIHTLMYAALLIHIEPVFR